MNRRDFLRAGTAVGVAGFGGLSLGASGLAAQAVAEPRAVGPLRLNYNENSMGLSSAAREAVQGAMAEAHRYPDALRGELESALASSLGLTSRHILLGNGSTEILQMIVQAHASPQATLVRAHPTFEAISRYQRPHPYVSETVPLDGRYAHDIDRMQDRVRDAGNPALVYLCNPNNPTATLTPSSEIDDWITAAAETTLFVVDEAYFEFVRSPGYRSAVHWVDKRPNVVVVRTFSKIYGMAGLRLGYAVAHPDTVLRLRAFMSSDNANALALSAALASLRDSDLVPRRRRANTAARKIVTTCLDELGLNHLPSHASFLMHQVPGDVRTYIQRMKEHDVLVGRPFPPLVSFSRLSLGRPDEMERFVEVVRSFRGKGWI